MNVNVRAREFIGALEARVARMRTLEGVTRKVSAFVVDIALVGSSVVAAIGAIVFAGMMLSQSDHRPKVNGLQYLAIFAQPRGAAKSGPPTASLEVSLARPSPAETAPINRAPIDGTPVGSIGVAAPAGAPIDRTPVGSIAAAAPTGAAGYAVVAAQPDLAWLRQGQRIFAVRPGDEIPGVGRVSAIARREGRWILVNAAGAALLTSGGPEVAGAAPAGSPFARRMIFGSDK